MTMTLLEWLCRYPEQGLLISAVIALCILPKRYAPSIVCGSLIGSITLWALTCQQLSLTTLSYGYYLTMLLILYVFMKRESVREHVQRIDHAKSIFVLIWAISGHFIIYSHHWLAFYIGIELVTLPFYAMIACSDHPRGIQVSLSYFMQNASVSILWLLSLVMFLGQGHSFEYMPLQWNSFHDCLFVFATICMSAFKLGVPPCAFWVADVYEVSSRSTIVWIGFVAKYLILVSIALWIEAGLISLPNHMSMVVIQDFLIAVTLYGHFAAYRERSIQRFLGYTAIAQTGFLLGPFLSGSDIIPGLSYLSIYVLSVLVLLSGIDKSGGQPREWRSKSAAYYLGLLSLSGLPPFPGFFAKVLVLQGLFSSVVCITFAFLLGLSTLVALNYYLDWFYYAQMIERRDFEAMTE